MIAFCPFESNMKVICSKTGCSSEFAKTCTIRRTALQNAPEKPVHPRVEPMLRMIDSIKREYPPMTDEQIKNFRSVLCGMIGPYALLMTRDQIQMYRDRMQANIDARV